MSKRIPPEAMSNVGEADKRRHARRFGGLLSRNLASTDRQAVLEETRHDSARAQTRSSRLLHRELQVLEIDREIEAQVKEGVGENQREYFLRERSAHDSGQIERRPTPTIAKAKVCASASRPPQMPEEAREKALYELDRLERMPPIAPEVGTIRNYIELMCDLPWDSASEDILDLKHAAEHSGRRPLCAGQNQGSDIWNFWRCANSIRHRAGRYCVSWGRPASAKLRLANQSRAVLGREFIRVSVGGIHDEAEVRGHRRTYIGSMPGRIIAALRRVKVKNPVFHVGRNRQAGPAIIAAIPVPALCWRRSIPEQNNAFADHYSGSAVRFVAGDVYRDRQPARSDSTGAARPHGSFAVSRLYRRPRKMQIATGFLIPKQVKENGISDKKIKLRRVGYWRSDSRLHARGGRAQFGARVGQHRAQSRATRRRASHESGRFKKVKVDEGER